jgi:hypothetical protein
MRFQFGEKKKDEIVTYDEKGLKIETPRDIVKELGPIPTPPPKEVPDELPPIEKEREDFLTIVEALDRINITLKTLKDNCPTTIIKPQTIATPLKNKGGRPKGYSPIKKKIVTEGL